MTQEVASEKGDRALQAFHQRLRLIREEISALEAELVSSSNVTSNTEEDEEMKNLRSRQCRSIEALLDKYDEIVRNLEI